jgi:hypothetical protein
VKTVNLCAGKSARLPTVTKRRLYLAKPYSPRDLEMIGRLVPEGQRADG